jgi:hypothetical protein
VSKDALQRLVRFRETFSYPNSEQEYNRAVQTAHVLHAPMKIDYNKRGSPDKKDWNYRWGIHVISGHTTVLLVGLLPC